MIFRQRWWFDLVSCPFKCKSPETFALSGETEDTVTTQRPQGWKPSLVCKCLLEEEDRHANQLGCKESSQGQREVALWGQQGHGEEHCQLQPWQPKEVAAPQWGAVLVSSVGATTAFLNCLNSQRAWSIPQWSYLLGGYLIRPNVQNDVPRVLLSKINGTYIELLGIRPVISICSKIHTAKFFPVSAYSPPGLIHAWPASSSCIIAQYLPRATEQFLRYWLKCSHAGEDLQVYMLHKLEDLQCTAPGSREQSYDKAQKPGQYAGLQI